MPRLAPASDTGATLVEVLAAVALMGIAFLTIVGGMMTTAIGSDVNSKQANVDGILRTYADDVVAADYVDCASTAAYTPEAVSTAALTGFTASAASVAYWQPDADPSTGSFEDECSSDEGLQRITLSVGSVDGRVTGAREVLKRRP
jgi:type II secretory pathway pseudopilin PulG